MQRLVRSSLVGALTIVGLAACGDKVTVTQPPSQVVDGTVKNVSVSPANATVTVGGTTTLAAAVETGPGVTDHTVTWKSSNTAVATVSSAGVVTGVAVGSTTIIASATADPSIQGAANVTVTGGVGQIAVTISSINQNTGAGSFPADLSKAFGQLDVILNVDQPQGIQLKSVQATLTCGTDSISAAQTVSDAAPAAAEAAAAPVTLSFNTAQFNSTTGVPAVHNGACTISASATTAGGAQSAKNSTTLTLKNVDGVIVSSAMSGASASDVLGLPWKSGSLTVSVLPVMYSGRTPATVTISVPGATNPAQTVSAVASGATTATWSGTSSSGSRITGKTIIGSYNANGFPQGVHPTVLVVDNTGVDLSLGQLNASSESDVRIDNEAPAQPSVFTTPAANNGWTNASYTFTGSSSKYMSGGDWGVANGSPLGAAGTVNGTPSPTGGITGGASSGLMPMTTIKYFAGPAASFVPLASTIGAACVTTGLQEITTAGDLAATLVSTAYKVRVLEADKLGNVRCTDLGGATTPAGTTFGVDKVAPTAFFDTATSAGENAIVNAAGAATPVPQWVIAKSDDASGFGAEPASTTITRQYPTAATCVLGSGASCKPVDTVSTLDFFGNKVAAVPAAGAGAGGEGYYTYTATVRDQAGNTAATLTRTALVDITAPIMGGIQVPAALIGGTSVNFATSATDNLDLVSSSYSLTYGNAVANSPGAVTNLTFRTPGPALGTAFDNTLTTSASFSVAVPAFLRNVQVTDAGGVPQAPAATNLPNAVVVRAVDAAGNIGSSVAATINAANVPQTSPAAVAFNALAVPMATWAVSNPATDVCNVAPGTNCVTATMPTTVTLTAQATGATGTFQLPFTQVQFYFFDTTVNEWSFIGTATASSVTDGAVRTFSWSVSGFNPPTNLGNGAPLNVIAIGVNGAGDAIATANNVNIALKP